MKNYGHISLDFLTRKFSVRLKRTSKILVNLIVFFFSVKLLTLDGLYLAVNAWSQESPALGLPVTLIYASLPVGGILMALFSLFEIVSEATGQTG
jgi:TRAP-type C4-dicarboxylate transport system permease small subunit